MEPHRQPPLANRPPIPGRLGLTTVVANTLTCRRQRPDLSTVRHDLLMTLNPLQPKRIKSIVDDLFLPLVARHQRLAP